MPQLPSNRQLKKLSEICIIERGWSPRPIEKFLTNDENGVNWIKIGDTKNQTKYITHTKEKIKPEWVKRSRMVYPWDFILSNSMSFGKPYIMGIKGCIHDWWLVLRPDHFIDKDFMYHLLWSNFMYAKFEQTAAWTGVKNLNIQKVKEIQILLPPLATQHKIVSKLDEISANIQDSKSKINHEINQLDELWASSLSEVFDDEKWDKVKLVDMVDIRSKNALPNDNKIYNYIGLENIESNTWNLVDFSPTKWSKIKSNKVKFEKWMILYGKLRPYLNKVHVTDFDWIATTEILPMKTKEWIDAQYLALFLRSQYFVNAANDSVSWARMPRVTTKFLQEYNKIPIPDLETQKSIVVHLNQLSQTISHIKAEYQSQLAYHDELWASVLDQAFKGDLVKE
jgi:type I restriction enzyme S subunit